MAVFLDGARAILVSYLASGNAGPVPTHTAVGTGTTAENRNQAGLTTEVENRVALASKGAVTITSANDTLRCIGGDTVMTANRTITEGGLVSAVSGGTFFIRTLTGSQVLNSGNSIALDFDIQFG